VSALDLKPSKQVYRAAVITSLPLTAGLVAWNLIANRSAPLLITVLIVVLVAGALGAMWLYFRNTRVVVDSGTVTKTNALGRQRRFAAEDVRTVLSDSFAVNANLTNQQLFVFDPRGRRLLRMRGEYWTPGQMAEVVDALRGKPEIVAEPMTPATMRKRYPGSVLWVEASPMGVALLITLVVAIGVVINFWLTGRFDTLRN
jgi:hypothetical protein